MYYKLRQGTLKKIMCDAIKKAGTERKLAKELKISKGTIYFLKFEKRNISEEYLTKLKDYLVLDQKNVEIISTFDSNWGQKKGGRILVQKKIKEGTFEDNLLMIHKKSSQKMKEWHKKMRINNPEKYYNWQYERFKKMGRGYNYTLKNGIKVRNHLEKKIGDFLIDEFKEVKYEEYLNINQKAYFPDFIHKNIIIEVTEWKHPSKKKLEHLNTKINAYKSENYYILFFIPNEYRKFYKELENSTVSTLTDLKDQIKAFIAQAGLP